MVFRQFERACCSKALAIKRHELRNHPQVLDADATTEGSQHVQRNFSGEDVKRHGRHESQQTQA